MLFVEKLREKKKSIKSSSVDTYLRNIRRLRKVKGKLPVPASDHRWVISKSLLEWYDKQPLNIRRHMATAAQVALDVYGKKSDAWKKRQTESMKEFDKDRRERKMTQKMKDKLPAKGFDTLKGVIATMKKELRHILIKSSKNWSFHDLLRVQELLILSLYYDYPLRLDYATLETKKIDGNCIYKNTKKPRGWHIQLKEYKTSKTMGTKIFKPNISNQRLLNKFVPAVEQQTDHGYLLSNNSKQRMSKQVLSKKLMSITKRRIGKNFSVQLIRILYAMKNRDVLESAKQVSEKMLHSTEQSLQYAKRD
jgi:hypothetical protein